MTPGEAIAALPCWKGAISIGRLSGGLSNENWLVTDSVGRHVVRFGRDYPFHHVSRDRELMVSRAAHVAGFGPAVEYAAPSVMVTAFLDARTYAAADVCADPARIGALLAAFHHGMAAEVSGPGFIFWPFHVIRDYARTIAACGSKHTPDLPHFLAMAQALEAAQVPMPIIFGHHDLLPANILDDGTRLWLIDYEYAGFGTAMFDLAGAASNAGMTPDQAKTLLTAYVGHDPAPSFQRAFDAMQCASLLREAMWAMVSALHLATPGVDFDAYARDNLNALAQALDLYQSSHGKLTP